MAKAKDEKRAGVRSKQQTKGRKVSSWKDFMPGVVCGGKLDPSVVNARMTGCTEQHLKELKASSAFKAWERGEDLHSSRGRLGTIAPFAMEHYRLFRERLDRVDSNILRKGLIALVVVLLALGATVLQRQSPSIEVLTDVTSEAILERMREERRLEENEQRILLEPKPEEVIRDVITSGLEEDQVDQQMVELEQLSQKIGDLELQVQMERKRASQAKQKEDQMFAALEASTKKVHSLSKHVKDSEGQIKLLESKVGVSVKHSAMLESLNTVLLMLESILVCSAMIAYVKSHKIRIAFLKARNSFLTAWRRQQRVLAAADEVYNDTLRYKSEVEASDVAPIISEANVLKPWDPIIGELDSLIKAHVEVDRNASPVQAMAALQKYFVDKKAIEQNYANEKQENQAFQVKISDLEQKMKDMIEERSISSQLKDQSQQNLEEEVKSLREKTRAAEERTAALEEQLKEFLNDKKTLSEQLVKSNEELERVTAYASSLEESSLVLEQKLQEASDVRSHLDEFEKTMNRASKVSNTSDEDEEDQLKENDIDNINDSILGERLKKIRQLIQEANASPFELLAPNRKLYEDEDSETALRNLPVIGPMHISSSDSDDEFTSRQDESLRRMLTASETLSGQVGEYISILEGMYSLHGNNINESVLSDLKEKKITVDRLRKSLVDLISASQKELRASNALKAKRREIDFLSEKEEQDHGEKELKAADALFYAREKEKNACIELEKGQSELRAALSNARELVGSAGNPS